MEICFAPMEGLTGYPLRKAHHEFFTGVDRYYSPFVNMNHTLGLRDKEKRDLDPANNQGFCLIPQIMANQAEPFLWAAARLYELGCREVNLNLGCPSGTVFSRGRGAGFLRDPDVLDAFFEEVFSLLDAGRLPSGGEVPPVKISVKTRLGVYKSEEARELVKIYNRYPLCEVIVHARVRQAFYDGEPDVEAFGRFLEESSHPVCYNGNLYTVEDIERIRSLFPELPAVMIGRGLLADPALAREYRAFENRTGRPSGEDFSGSGTPAAGSAALSKAEARGYHDALVRYYTENFGQPGNVLPRMKELWFYWGEGLNAPEKSLKKIRKAKNMGEYTAAVDELMAEMN